MPTLSAFLNEALVKRESEYLLRKRNTLESPQSVHCVVGGKAYISFASNDYLGLANDDRLRAALIRGVEKFGVGSGASHLISGHSLAHQQLEERLAAFCGREKALLYSAGYMANIGVITALTGKHDQIFQDKLNHASLIDAGRQSEAKMLRYPHVDTSYLKYRLQDATSGNRLIVSDGVFSMHGSVAPITELVKLSREYRAWLMIDDAHGFGVLGKTGSGVCEQASASQDEVPILMATLGKALGTSGAFVAGSSDLIDYLIQFSRPYIYTTAMPPAIAHASMVSLDIIDQESWRREKLHSLIDYFRSTAISHGLDLEPSTTPIQPVQIGDNRRVIQIEQVLRDKGFLVGAIRPPTVPINSARLRVVLTTAHEENHIDDLLNHIAEALRHGQQ